MAAPSANEKEPLAILRYTIVGSVQNLVILDDLILRVFEGINNLGEKLAMTAKGKAFDVLEHEILWLQFQNKPDEVMNKGVSRIIQSALTDHRKSLARRAPEYDIYVLVANVRLLANELARGRHDAAADRCAPGKVEFMGGGMNGVNLNRSHYIKTRLLETETKSACARKQVNTNWSSLCFFHCPEG